MLWGIAWEVPMQLSFSLSFSLTHSLSHSLSLSASLVLAYLCVCAVQESGQRTVWAMLRSSYSLVWACLQWFERVYASESGLPASVCFCRCNFWCSFRCMVSAPRLQRLVWHRHRYQHQLQSAATPRYVWSRPNKSTKKSHTTKPKQQTPKKKIKTTTTTSLKNAQKRGKEQAVEMTL